VKSCSKLDGERRWEEALGKAWGPWFANHGGFRFTEEETFIDEKEQKALFRWQLEWPSLERGYEGKPEKRRGVDVLHFQDGRIIKKLTYSKTTIEIGGEKLPLPYPSSEKCTRNPTSFTFNRFSICVIHL
jgi:hypothetical protein